MELRDGSVSKRAFCYSRGPASIPIHSQPPVIPAPRDLKPILASTDIQHTWHILTQTDKDTHIFLKNSLL